MKTQPQSHQSNYNTNANINLSILIHTFPSKQTNLIRTMKSFVSFYSFGFLLLTTAPSKALTVSSRGCQKRRENTISSLRTTHTSPDRNCIGSNNHDIITQFATPFMTSIAITLAVVSTTFPTAASAASIEAGQVLFDQNCASCHRGGENIMKPNKNLKKETLLKNFGGGANDALNTEEIVTWIGKSGQHKRLVFPNVPGGKLSSENYEDVISFIVDQASNEKW
jgi:cytochrome c6